MNNTISALICFVLVIYAVLNGIAELSMDDTFNQCIGVYAICCAIACFYGGCWFLFA